MIIKERRREGEKETNRYIDRESVSFRLKQREGERERERVDNKDIERRR